MLLYSARYFRILSAGNTDVVPLLFIISSKHGRGSIVVYKQNGTTSFFPPHKIDHRWFHSALKNEGETLKKVISVTPAVKPVWCRGRGQK
jgi:hypothetical protein